MTFWSLLIGAYLLGAVPFGLLIGLARGIDIRQHGSRNIGATNCGRVVGKGAGLLCLYLDILKGLLPAVLGGWLLTSATPSAAEYWRWLAVGGAAVLGHTFPVYLGFRGGKGVATTIGVALGVFPFFTVGITAALLSYALVRYSLGVVSAGSLALAATFPIAVAAHIAIRGASVETHWPLLAVACALALLIVARHAENIRRLLGGRELAARDATEPAEAGSSRHPST